MSHPTRILKVAQEYTPTFCRNRGVKGVPGAPPKAVQDLWRHLVYTRLCPSCTTDLHSGIDVATRDLTGIGTAAILTLELLHLMQAKHTRD